MSDKSVKRAKSYIEVGLESAKDLLSYDSFSRTSDPFAKICLKKDEEKVDDCTKSYQSTIKEKTLDPVWDETFLFKQDGETELIIRIYDYNKLQDAELMTTLVIPISEVSDEEQEESTLYPLIKEGTEDEPAGKLELKLEAFPNLRQMKGKARKLRQENDQLHEKVGNLEKEKVTLETDKASLEKDNTEQKSELGKLQKQVEEFQVSQKGAEEIDNTEQKNELEKLQKQVEEFQASQKGADEIDNTLKENQKSVDNLQKTNEDLRLELVQAKKEIDGLKNAQALLVSENSKEVKGDVEKQSQHPDQKAEKEGEIAEELAKTTQMLQDLEKESDELQKENEHLKQLQQENVKIKEEFAERKSESGAEVPSDGKSESEAVMLLEKIRILSKAKTKLEEELKKNKRSSAKASKIRWSLWTATALVNILVLVWYFVRKRRSQAG